MSASRNSVIQQIEDLEDERDDYAAMLARVESANEEVIPISVIKRLSNGESPVTVWREYRGLSEQELSDASGVGVPTLQIIEKLGSEGVPLSFYAAIARALDIDLDMLVPWTPEGEPESA